VPNFIHKPVLLTEVLAALKPRDGGRYADGTLGGAGHAAAILGASSPTGWLYGSDRDGAALQAARTRLAEFEGTEAALVFPTGFQTNTGVISSLVHKGEYIIGDKYIHACIMDGCMLSHGTLVRYDHNNMGDLEDKLAKIPAEAGKLIITDGVFSMEGDICNLPAIVQLARQYGAQVMVDDAHGIGVLGKGGAGTADHFGLTVVYHQRFALVRPAPVAVRRRTSAVTALLHRRKLATFDLCPVA